MSSFVPRAIPPTLAEPDPTKHVKYTLGMVLGVDDFTQEFAYLAGRDRWLARDLLGYGTVTGLRVGVEIENRAPQIFVTPGVALSPRGQFIRVAPSQCADLNLWLGARHEELRQRLAGVGGNRALLRLYLVLAFRDCATDMVPIPGEPCRSQDETMAPSRLADDFKLELRYEVPDQREEDALRDFVEWLGQVEVTDEPGSFSTLEELEKALRDSTRAPSSPPSPPDFFYGSPPEALRIHPSMAYEYLRAAFRLWTTELRPKWHETRGDRGDVLPGAAAAADDDSVLLAEVSVPLARATANTIWQVEDGKPIEIHEERRPYLVHLRMLQELVVSGRRAGGGATSGGASIGPAFGVVSETSFGLQPTPGKRFDYARADHTHGTPPAPVLVGDVTGPVNSTTVASIRNREVVQTAPAEGQVLTFTAGKWQPATPAAGGGGGGSAPSPSATVTAATSFGLTANGGTSLNYARADHTHGTPPAPTLAGDVTGATNVSKVVAIQGVSVDATKPTTTGQLLGFDAALNRWKPVAPPAAAVGPAAATNVVTRPSELSEYSIVAAGVLRGVEDSKGSTGYNNLHVTKVADGAVTMIFDRYQQPSEEKPTHQYIVKALAVVSPRSEGLETLSVVFGGFGDNATGFTLLVNNRGARVPVATLNSLSFMVEVSYYELKTITTFTSKAKETKESKEKDTKESKEKDTKESKDTKDTKDTKETTKETKESKEKAGAGETSKVTKDTDTSIAMPAGAPTSLVSDDAAADGRAFIAEEERPEVGRAALDLANKQDDKLPEANTTGKQPEAFN